MTLPAKLGVGGGLPTTRIGYMHSVQLYPYIGEICIPVVLKLKVIESEKLPTGLAGIHRLSTFGLA